MGAEGGRSHLTMSPQDLRRLISGRESLQDMLLSMIAKPLPIQACPSCLQYLSRYWIECLIPNISTPEPWGCWLLRTLYRMCDPDNDELHLATCAGCAAEHYTLAWYRMAVLKESIPRFFFVVIPPVVVGSLRVGM